MEWPRNVVGTLMCPCGKPGTIFTMYDTEIKDCTVYGLFAGYCSDECKERGFDIGTSKPGATYLVGESCTESSIRVNVKEVQPGLF